jgi:Uma2 family endonuclease
MVMSRPQSSTNSLSVRRYLRPPAPLHFPESELVPESGWHFRSRVVLFESLRHEFKGGALVTSDQFVYWDPTDPGQRLAPDVAVRRGAADEVIGSWKTWERGAPHVGVEIVSDSDASESEFAAKLERYRRAGVAEVVRFDPASPERPLRMWDRFDGDLVERDLSIRDSWRSDVLGVYWCAANHPELGSILRLSRDAAGTDLLLTPEEAERAARQAERDATDAERRAREAEREAKEAALARIAELEAELKQRG